MNDSLPKSCFIYLFFVLDSTDLGHLFDVGIAQNTAVWPSWNDHDVFFYLLVQHMEPAV